MTELSPRERRAQRTQRAILDAARQIITKKGVEALSMRAIANAIDYSPAGLYEYFGSKEEIIEAVVNQGFERFTDHLRRVDQSLPLEEYMVELGMAYIDFAVKNPDFYLLMFTTLPLEFNLRLAEEDCEPAEVPQQASFILLLQTVQRCIDEGFLQTQPDLGPFEMAYALWSLGHGIAMLRVTLLKDLPLEYEKVDRAVIQAFHLGLQRSGNS